MSKIINEYFSKNRIHQQSEKIFVKDFIVPIIGIEKLEKLKSQVIPALGEKATNNGTLK